MNIEGRLGEFSTYFNNELESIEGLSAKNHETLFKKKLYISFLESLAKAAFLNEKGVKKRFKKFLDEFTNWEEWNHCCPICLHKEDDEKHAEIQKILHANKYVMIEDVSISNENCNNSKCTYADLLYTTRNSIVHQLQASTEWETSIQRHKIESPFYQIGVTQIFDKYSRSLRDDKSILS